MTTTNPECSHLWSERRPCKRHVDEDGYRYCFGEQWNCVLCGEKWHNP